MSSFIDALSASFLERETHEITHFICAQSDVDPWTRRLGSEQTEDWMWWSNSLFYALTISGGDIRSSLILFSLEGHGRWDGVIFTFDLIITTVAWPTTLYATDHKRGGFNGKI